MDTISDSSEFVKKQEADIWPSRFPRSNVTLINLLDLTSEVQREHRNRQKLCVLLMTIMLRFSIALSRLT